MNYSQEFVDFLAKMESVSGSHALIEAVREGYFLTHPQFEGKLKDLAKKGLATAALAGTLTGCGDIANAGDESETKEYKTQCAYIPDETLSQMQGIFKGFDKHDNFGCTEDNMEYSPRDNEYEYLADNLAETGFTDRVPCTSLDDLQSIKCRPSGMNCALRAAIAKNGYGQDINCSEYLTDRCGCIDDRN